jgi:hypothetical protein
VSGKLSTQREITSNLNNPRIPSEGTNAG